MSESVANKRLSPIPSRGEALRRAVLIVSEDSELRGILGRYLPLEGYMVTLAKSGGEALELLRERPFDAILLDMLVFDPDEARILSLIRQQASPEQLPIIVFAEAENAVEVKRALDEGANDVITGVVVPELVAARIQTLLELKSAQSRADSTFGDADKVRQILHRILTPPGAGSETRQDWAERVSRDVARAIGVQEIGLWTVSADKAHPLRNSLLSPPTVVDLAMVLKGSTLDRQADRVYPIMSGDSELVGIVIVPGKETDWTPIGSLIIDVFTRQLALVLELLRLQEESAERDSLEPPPPQVTLPPETTHTVQICRVCGACFDVGTEHCENCGPGALLHPTRTIPHLIAKRYRLERLLGHGGMGMVFASRDELLGREVAIKVIHPSFIGDDKVRARFEREARVVAGLQNPHVVEVHDCGALENGSFFIVMEMLNGRSIDELVRQYGRGTPLQVSRFLKQAAPALDAAHAAGIIHRDIQPANFVLLAEGDRFAVKVLDFGLARSQKLDEDITEVGTIVGTPLYMSPEQAMGHPLDHHSDLYSFAAVTFHALVGRHLSDEKAYHRIVRDIVKNKPPDVSSYLPNVPRKVDKAFRWALSKQPEQRPSSAVTWVSSFVTALKGMKSDTAGWVVEATPRPSAAMR